MAEFYGFHILECSAVEGSSDTHFVNSLTHEYGDGFSSSVLIGAEAGLKTFNIPYDKQVDFALSSDTGRYIFRGKSYTRAQYLENLFVWQRTTGQPFAVRSNRTNQIYLARFDETEHTLTKKLIAEYQTNIKLKQMRVPNRRIYDLSQINLWGWYEADYYATQGYDDNDSVSAIGLFDYSGNENHLFGIDGITYQTNEFNTQGVARLNGTDGYFVRNEAFTFYEAFMLVRFNEEEFTSYQGVLSGAGAGEALLLTDNEGTDFYDLSHYELYEFKNNGVLYEQSASPAPMETFAVIHIRIPDGFALTALQVGKDRDLDRFGNFDLQALIIPAELTSEQQAREITEYLLYRQEMHPPIDVADVTSPSIPTGLNLMMPLGAPDPPIEITWSPSTDNVAVAGYELLLNHSDTYINEIQDDVSPASIAIFDTAFPFYAQVRAYDAAGNRSGWSAAVGIDPSTGSLV
jgi:hypothetical protein